METIIAGKLALSIRVIKCIVKVNPHTLEQKFVMIKPRKFLDYELLHKRWLDNTPLRFTAHVFKDEIRVKDSRPTGKTEKGASLTVPVFLREAILLLGKEDGQKWVNDITQRLGE